MCRRELSLSFSFQQESERYAYEWQRCLESALQVCVPNPSPVSRHSGAARLGIRPGGLPV